MKLQGLNPFELNKLNIEAPKSGLNNTSNSSGVNNFENIFNEFVGSVNTDQMNSSKATSDFLSGENIEIHEVMIAAEKARTSLDLLMEIRNKSIDMYKELTRVPV